MANHKSAVKRHKQSLVRNERNRANRTRAKNAAKTVQDHILAQDKEQAQQQLRLASSVLDKTAGKGSIHWKRLPARFRACSARSMPSTPDRSAMRHLVLAVCLLAAFLSPALCRAGSEDLERGITLYNEDQYEQARSLWEAGELAGDTDCTMALGIYVYAAGRGAPQSDVKAFEQYMKAARKDHADGMSVVGTCYLYGMGVARDRGKGIAWLEKAANAGFVTASAELGDLYADGELVKKDAKLAAKWHLRAARDGHPQSQFYMGRAYMSGNGVSRDKAAAKEWLQKALAGGEDAAKALLEKLQ